MIKATGKCEFCDFELEIRGENVIEIGKELRKEIFKHIASKHPELNINEETEEK